MAVDNFGVDVPIKFGDSRSNGFRDIRGADFVSNKRSNERTNIKWPIPIARNAITIAFRPKRKTRSNMAMTHASGYFREINPSII